MAQAATPGWKNNSSKSVNKVLNILNAQTHTLDHADRQLQLQCWQQTAQLFFNLKEVRKSLVIPGFKTEVSEKLFTMKDVEQHRWQQSLHKIRPGNEKETFPFHKRANFAFNGRIKLPQQGSPFRSPTGNQQQAASSTKGPWWPEG